jgi:hypothetical protein
MKTFKLISGAVVILLALCYQAALAGSNANIVKENQQDFLVLRGKVTDAESGSPLVFATVAVSGTNIAIVTNIDGEFTLKIAEEYLSKNLEISYLGYKNKVLLLGSLKDNGYKNIISMEVAPIPIKEIIVKPVDPEEIVSKAISRITRNYESVPNLMTAFYRETIRKNRAYISIGEAVLEIFKAPYNSDVRFDATRVYKGRKSQDNQKLDTILFKLQGGPVSVLELDIAKNSETILTLDAMKNYDYSLASVIEINGKPHYTIAFKQKPSVSIPLFVGKMYIDMNTSGITEAEFGFNLSDKDLAASIFIRKKPLGMDVTPELASYWVKYREQNGKLYFEYSRAEVKFKVNWKKKLFNTYYTTMSEIAVTDRTAEEVIKFAGKEKIKYSDVFSEKVTAFTDPDFWGEYNVIEPDQSIESAIRKLSRKVKFNNMEDLQQ